MMPPATQPPPNSQSRGWLCPTRVDGSPEASRVCSRKMRLAERSHDQLVGQLAHGLLEVRGRRDGSHGSSLASLESKQWMRRPPSVESEWSDGHAAKGLRA